MKEVWNIIDRAFAHTRSCNTNYFEPTYFNWNRNFTDTNVLFITDHDIYKIFDIKKEMKKIAFLCESPFITESSYNFVLQNYNNFDIVLTHNDKLLKNCPNALFYPLGGTYLTTEEMNLCATYIKTKMISMMFSNKQYAPGHILRHNIFNSFKKEIEYMGSGVTGITVAKYLSLKDYKFTIAVENIKEDFYFSEKLIECFLTKTVPIYWGCPSIGNFFNIDGLITFDTIDDLKKILQNWDFLINFYNTKTSIINENYNIAQKYKVAEDYIYTNYKKLLYT